MQRASAFMALVVVLAVASPAAATHECSKVAGIRLSDCDDHKTPKPRTKKRSASAPIQSAPAAEAMLFGELNAARARRGLPRLLTHGIAASIARSHARTMARRGSAFHNPALGSTWLKSTLGWPVTHGENVGYAQSARSIHNAFMRSAGHSGNILNSAYDHVGVGVVKEGRYYYAVELFLGGARYYPSSSWSGSGGRRLSKAASRVVHATALLERMHPPARVAGDPVHTQTTETLPWGAMTLGLTGMLLPGAARAALTRRRRR